MELVVFSTDYLDLSLFLPLQKVNHVDICKTFLRAIYNHIY
ncbi:hypothetical protein VC87395_003576 [Vibrio paracholerae 87395]|nr:hypothetical protein VCHE09_3356 [Vibrio paracholerae HE-09]EMP86805.1 hypothetical protein VC87395_003576 [Vibrio paracholerae 87395]